MSFSVDTARLGGLPDQLDRLAHHARLGEQYAGDGTKLSYGGVLNGITGDHEATAGTAGHLGVGQLLLSGQQLLLHLLRLLEDRLHVGKPTGLHCRTPRRSSYRQPSRAGGVAG